MLKKKLFPIGRRRRDNGQPLFSLSGAVEAARAFVSIELLQHQREQPRVVWGLLYFVLLDFLFCRQQIKDVVRLFLLLLLFKSPVCSGERERRMFLFYRRLFPFSVIQNFRDFYPRCKSRHFYLFDVATRFISILSKYNTERLFGSSPRVCRSAYITNEREKMQQQEFISSTVFFSGRKNIMEKKDSLAAGRPSTAAVCHTLPPSRTFFSIGLRLVAPPYNNNNKTQRPR